MSAPIEPRHREAAARACHQHTRVPQFQDIAQALADQEAHAAETVAALADSWADTYEGHPEGCNVLNAFAEEVRLRHREGRLL